MSEKRCPQREQLAQFVSGRLSKADAVNIKKHIEECDDCDVTVNSLSGETVPGPKQPKTDDEQSPPIGNLLNDLRNIPNELQQTKVSGSTDGGTRKAPVAVGDQLSNYVLEEQIAESGMGVVFKARHRRLGQHVALKVLRPHAMRDPAAVERFHQEIAASGKLEHPNIVLARDADEANGIHFLVMELIDGRDLHSLVKAIGPLQIADASEIVRQAAVALQHVADNGMVHRDIKPSNLMLTKDGQVKLLDLGLAKLRDDSDSEDDSITSTGQIMGTVDYISPEQATDSRSADIRADIYSLGCTLYYLLTGNAPFKGDGSRLMTLMAHAQDAPPQLPESVPAGVQDLYLQMVAKDPASRPQPPSVIAERLLRFAAGHDLRSVAGAVSNPVDNDSTGLAVAESARSSELSETRLSQPAAAQDRGGAGIRRRLLAFGLIPFAILCGVLIYVATDNGTVVVKVADNIKDQVMVSVVRNGKPLVEGWRVSSNDQSRSIRTGPVEVQIQGDVAADMEIAFDGGVAEVTRGERLIVTISRPDSQVQDVLDVLSLVDINRDKVAGYWKTEGDTLTGENLEGSRPSLLELPVVVDGSYQLEIGFTRLSGDESLNINLPIGDHAATCIIDGFPNRDGGGHTGLQRLDDKALPDSPEAVVITPLVNNQRSVVSIRVRIDGTDAAVNATLDGKELFDWSGKASRLTPSGIHAGPNPERLSLSVLLSTLKFDLITFSQSPGKPGETSKIQHAPHTDWVELFNGEDLRGWEQIGATGWRVRDGILSVPPSGKGWLGTVQDFKDFELELEYRITLPGGNSGVFLRAFGKDGLRPVFPEIQILDDDHPDFEGIARSNHTACFQSVAATSKVVKSVVGTWHSMRIECIGRRVQVWFDGDHVVDGITPDDKLRESGQIGLQTYDSSGIEFRNVRVREMTNAVPQISVEASPPRDTDGWITLFDGHTLDAWEDPLGCHPRPAPDGTIAFDDFNCRIFTKESFRNFEVEFEYLVADGGNGGVFIHCEPSDTKWAEVQILDDTHPRYADVSASQLTGSLQAIMARAADFTQESNKFTKMTVQVEDRSLQVRIDGRKVLDTVIPIEKDPRGKGRIGLQRQDAKMLYRNIRVRHLP